MIIITKSSYKSSVLTFIVTLSVLVYLLLMPRSVSSSVVASINSCLYGVIPSLFCFMLLSKLIVNSGVAYIISRPFGNLFYKLTGLPAIGFSVYLFSFLSGYPSGVIASVDLYKNGSIKKSEAERLCAVTNNTGPALPVILIGTQILNQARIGAIIYLIQVLSSVVALFLFRDKNNDKQDTMYSDSYKKDFITAFCESVEGSVKACAVMCGYIILFNVVGDAIPNVFGNNILFHIFRPFLEISSGSAHLTNVSDVLKFAVLSSALTFGGLCVHMQAASVMSSHGLSSKKHFYFKSIQALLAFVFSCIIIFVYQINLF